MKPMTIQKMHWRGLTMTGLAEAAKGAGDRAGKAIDAALEFVAASTERIAAFEGVQRRIGIMKGRLHVAEDFDVPLPPDVLTSFEGGADPDFMRGIEDQPVQERFDADIRQGLKEAKQGKTTPYKFGS